jgi:hypothetical protein
MERINRVSKLIEGFESPHGMELLATVHWVARENQQARADLDAAIGLVHSWNARKARIFPPQHIRVAHQQLSELGWL